MGRPRTPALLIAAVAAVATLAPSADASLATRLTSALRGSGASRTGVLAVSLGNGGNVYGRHAGRSLRPASNEKLTVALAALDRLGPGFRIPTYVLGSGRRAGSVWIGSLVLKGFGDPTLSRADLRVLARRIRDSGITRVTGRVLGDESYFDRVRTAPGWKPSYFRLECSPLSALMVDEGMIGPFTVYDPARVAASQFSAALGRAGVTVAHRPRKGRAGATAVPLASVTSPRLVSIVRRMNKASDNVIAEMLLKELGAVKRGHGTTAAGAGVVRRVLGERGVPLRGVRIVDGSGLSDYDRLTARAIAALLISAWSDPVVAQPLYRSLAIAGVDGTLDDRMRSGPARGTVRAKTGTTLRASALSGFVGTRYVFSILMNGNPVPVYSARAAQDRFAQVLAAG